MAGRFCDPVRRTNGKSDLAEAVGHGRPLRLLRRHFQRDGAREAAGGVVAGGDGALSDALVHGDDPHVVQHRLTDNTPRH